MGRFQVPPHTALHLRTVQKGPCVSFLLATESPNISEPGSPEESLVHPGHAEREEGTARGSQYGTHIFKPELNREMFTSQLIQATFWLFSVWIATLKSKHESIENSEVAFICVYLFIFKLKGIRNHLL